MKVRACAPAAALCLSLLSPAAARADCEWAEELFHLRGTSGAVRAFVVFDDGSGAALYAGGDFTAAGDAPADHVARWDGSAWTALGAGVNGAVHALAVFDDGSGPALYAGGTFTAAGGAAANNIARWDGSAWAPLGAGVDGTVRALAVFDDGSGPALHAGGDFLMAGGAGASRVARWSGSAWAPLGAGVGGSVNTLAVFAEGGPAGLYAGGTFSTAGGIAAQNIARWGAGLWSPLAGGTNGSVRALAVFNDGGGPGLYAGGTFTVAGGGANRIARWRGGAWAALGVGTNGSVLSLAVFDDGGGPGLYAGGEFALAGGSPASRIARWRGGAWAAPGTGVSSSVFALAIFDDGGGAALHAGGLFTTAGGGVATHAARWNGASWRRLGDGNGLSGPVLALAVYDDGRGPALHAGGQFTTAGAAAASSIARWDGTAWTGLGSGTDGVVSALAVFDDGAGPSLFAGGQFTAAGGSGASNVARWNGIGWAPLGAGTNGAVMALAVFDDGTGTALYAGGFFSSAGGGAAQNIARWLGGSWTAVGGGFSGVTTVRALQVFDDGGGPALYAGGDFTTAGGMPASRVARWNGSGWSPLGAGTSDRIFALAAHDDGGGPALYAGGSFLGAGGMSANRVARWKGGAWSPLGDGMNNIVLSLLSFDDGGGPALYAGGQFTSAGTGDAARLARWDGSAWSPVGAGMNNAVNALSIFDDGDGGGPALHAGGFFAAAGGEASGFVAKRDGPRLPEIFIPPVGGDICDGEPFTLGVVTDGPPPLSYQWLRDGGEIEGATADTYSLEPAVVGDSGVYAIAIRNDCGETLSAGVRLTVEGMPAIETQPQGRTACVGDEVHFNVAASGGMNILYQWRKDGEDIPGATGSSFGSPNIVPGDAGSYEVLVSTSCGSALSDAAVLAVEEPPVVLSPPGEETACEGDTVVFSVAASGSPPLLYQWRKDGAEIPGATASAFAVAAAATTDDGTYDVLVANNCGTVASAGAALAVEVAPGIITHPVSQPVCRGDAVTFAIAASGSPPLVYQWRHDGAEVPGATEALFTLTGVTEGDAGDYDVVVTNNCGAATTKAASLTVQEEPEITAPPAGAVTCPGESVTFTVAATGVGPLAYQWRHDGMRVVGATGDSYAILFLSESDAGSYDVVVTNACGAVTSAPALLELDGCFHRGDADGSGVIVISDGVAIFNFLFLGGRPPGCTEAADVNNSGDLDISDGIALLNYLFLGGSPPASPGPTDSPCGRDPDAPGSPGDLGCKTYNRC